MKKTINGFTIVELLIVIAIVGLLTMIGMISFESIQADSRDSQRSSNIYILAEALEKYYDLNGEYPSCADITIPSVNTVTRNTLKGLDPTNLSTPTTAAGTNSTICNDLASVSTDSYSYTGTGPSCSTTGGNCLNFTLQWRKESDGTIISVTSRRSADLAALSNPVIGSITSTSTQITVNWNSVVKAQTYSISISSSADMSSPTTTSNMTSLSKIFSGLPQGARYYFRVDAQAMGFVSSQSSVANKQTTVNTPAAPAVSATISGSNAVGTTSATTCPAGTTAYYQTHYNTSDGAWSTLTSWSATPPTSTVAANQGSKHGFQSHAKCTSLAAIDSSTTSYTTATVIRSISSPAAPTYSSPTYFITNQFKTVNWITYCPAGTSESSAYYSTKLYFTSRDWNGDTWGPHPNGYNDSWEGLISSTPTVSYYGQYRCASAYATSGNSPTTTKNGVEVR